MTCQHGIIQTFSTEDGVPVMWACAVCRLKFEPLKIEERKPLTDVMSLALPGDMSPWQPIETAPMGGQWVITFDGEEVTPNYYIGGEIENWAKSPWGITPTHWMPLPAAPIEAPNSIKE